MQPPTVSAGSVMTAAAKKSEIASFRWVTSADQTEAFRQHVLIKRSPAAQIGSIGLDRYFDRIDPQNNVFSKNSTPSTSLPQSAFPKMMKALRFFRS
ncbi:hypothetical protein BIW11_10563 [Tropilaelaps mercedesae]|uniref:Uncharacterized protein n=1 Tax=Tropilaelaps mercedesae TaxID=418985 RepID=A0A1V9XFL6_9ACAR|nr:hypothetical protein BIW11_10563 [Tropilaelaps mercedesae]